MEKPDRSRRRKFISSEEGHVVGFDGRHSSISNGNGGRQQSNSDDDARENGESDQAAARRRHVVAHLYTVTHVSPVLTRPPPRRRRGITKPSSPAVKRETVRKRRQAGNYYNIANAAMHVLSNDLDEARWLCDALNLSLISKIKFGNLERWFTLLQGTLDDICL